MNHFIHIYRKTLYACGARSLSVFTSSMSNVFDFVGEKLDMARLHLPNTRRHKFVGDVTTVGLCPENQIAGRTKTPRGVHVALAPNV